MGELGWDATFRHARATPGGRGRVRPLGGRVGWRGEGEGHHVLRLPGQTTFQRSWVGLGVGCWVGSSRAPPWVVTVACRPDQRKSRLTSGDRGVTNSYEADKCDSALTTDCEADAVIDVVKHQITDAEVVEQVPPSPSLVFFLSEHVHADLMCQSCRVCARGA